MIGTILNISNHNCDASTVLGWMLWRWQRDEGAKLVIITHAGDGHYLDNRVRVAFSKVRSSMKKQGIKDFRRFGYTSEVAEWTMEDGTQRDVLYVQRLVSQRHTFTEILASMDI